MNSKFIRFMNQSNKTSVGGEIRMGHKLIIQAQAGKGIAARSNSLGLIWCFLWFSGEIFIILHSSGIQFSSGFWFGEILDDRT